MMFKAWPAKLKSRCLTLDEKAFEKVLKEKNIDFKAEGLDFVIEKSEPRAELATNLSAYLQPVAAPEVVTHASV